MLRCKQIKWKVFLVIVVILTSLMLISAAVSESTLYSAEEQALWDAYQSREIIRLHIIADNNSPAAQCMKLQIRDAILSIYGDLFSSCSTFSSAYEAICTHQQQIQQTAQAIAWKSVSSLKVQTSIGLMWLPEKTYGCVTLPAGEYRALRITIGRGEGRNWWCVLFPRLCLATADDSNWIGKNSMQNEKTVIWDALRLFRCWMAWPI